MTKRFFAHIRSESCDDYYIQFEADKKPKHQEWIPLFKAHLPGEDPEYLYVKHCEEITV